MTHRSCGTCLYSDFATESDTCAPCLSGPLMSRPNWTPREPEVADIERLPCTAQELADEPILDAAMAPVDVKAYIADEAKRIVSGSRRSAYGPPENNFARIARYWTVHFQNTGRDITVTPQDVSPMMRLMKEARLDETPDHLDSHVDLVGYALTGAEVAGVKIPLD